MSSSDDDAVLTLRIPRTAIAVAIALVVHVVVFALVDRLPAPRPPPQRIELTLAPPQPPPAPPSLPSPPAPRPRPQPPRAPPPPSPAVSTPALPPSTAPVVPELQPSEADRPRLALAERATTPAPPPAPSWKDRTLQALASTRPAPALLPDALRPTASALDRIAAADPRLHDEQTERRLMEDHGTFFRRGLEALRGNWHPEDVLRMTERDPTRRCGRTNRTTYAVAVLDRRGNVVDVDLKHPSGCPELDVEAVAAFKRVAQFPNPPAGIFVGPDGAPLETARYPVRFIVTFDGGLRLDWWG